MHKRQASNDVSKLLTGFKTYESFLLIPRQYWYTAYRQVIRWAYGVLGRSIRKTLLSCVVSTIRQNFQSGDQTYQGFQWPHLDEN